MTGPDPSRPGRLDIRTQRPSVNRLTDAGRLAVLERSRYEPLADLPDDPNEHFPARCLLCDREVKVNMTTLHGSDLDRRRWDDESQQFRLPRARRGQCAHPKNPRKPHPVRPFTQAEAKALLKALDGEGSGQAALASAIKKLRRVAGLREEEQ